MSPAPRPFTAPIPTANRLAASGPQPLPSDALAPSLRTPVDAACNALYAAISRFGATPRGTLVIPAHVAYDVAAYDVRPLDRSEDEGSPGASPVVGAREIRWFDHDAHGPRTLPGDQVYAAVGAYARALRETGVELPAVLAAVHAAVAGAAQRELGDRALAAVQRDAAQWGLSAFFAS